MTRAGGSLARWSIIAVVLACCLVSKSAGSAIPMWEFLTRDEKMSHLYKIFSKQVAIYCSDSPLPDCNKNLLVSGVRSLANMDDNELDQIDPYQRGAKDTIWRAMIGEKKSKYNPEDPYYNADTLATSESDQNGIGEESAPVSDYARLDEHSGPYLVGPMVIRVFPDGRPVPGDAQRPLPRDEDIDEFKYTKVPSVADIEAVGERFFYKKLSYDATAGKRNIFARVNQGQRPAFVATTKNSHYRRVNPLFLEHRLPDKTSTDTRTLRFY